MSGGRTGDEPRILVTGATGQVGWSTAKRLLEMGYAVIGATTDPNKAERQFGHGIRWVRFDFLDPSTYDGALEGVDRVFLMRPPALSKPEQLKPFVDHAREKGVEQVVFLSLLGIEKNPFPPHAKIEKLLQASGMAYTFLRPSFFMQNLTGPHLEDIRDRNELLVPARKAPVSFVDTRDIGEAAARILAAPIGAHRNMAYDLTGPEALTYAEAAAILSRVLGRSIVYPDPGVLHFRRHMIRRGFDKGYVNVMCMLYLLTGFGMSKRVTDDLERLLGRRPTSLEAFVRDHAGCWQPAESL